MSFPTIHTKATNIELTPELETLLEQKLEPLVKFLPAEDSSIKCDVELQKITEQQSGKIFRAEINLFISGTMYRATATEDQMEKAIDTMRDEVKKEIRRSNSKRDSLMRRGGRKLKDMMRFGRE